jgi:hypothetical protein
MRAISAVAAPALAGTARRRLPREAKCNAAPVSDSLANTGHCFMRDPGNSYTAGNHGGTIPTSGGVPNPGGNAP